MVKIKDMENLKEEETQVTPKETTVEINAEETLEGENVEINTEETPETNEEGMSIDDMFNFDNEEENIEEEDTGDEEVKEEGMSDEGQKEKSDTKEENIGQEEGNVDELINELLSKAEKIGGEEVDAAAEEVQTAVDEGAPEDEILKKLAELEDTLANETMANESLSREKDKLLQKISDLQDKLSDYELKSYEYDKVLKTMDSDPTFKGFVKMLATYKHNPERVGKNRIISALDDFTSSEFGVSISDILKQKAEDENSKMTMGAEQQPIEITVDTGEGNPIDEMFNI